MASNNSLMSTERAIIHKWCSSNMGGGMKCPYCGEIVYWITHAHAEKHNMTRKELKAICRPFGSMRDTARTARRREERRVTV